MPETRRERSWGVEGCLYGAVALFAVMLVLMLLILFGRFGSPS